MSATTSASVAKTVGKFDPYVDAYESKVMELQKKTLQIMYFARLLLQEKV